MNLLTFLFLPNTLHLVTLHLVTSHCTNLITSTPGWRYEVWCNHVVYAHIHTQEAEPAQQKKTLLSEVSQSHGRPQQKDTFGGDDCEFFEPPTSTFQTHRQFNTQDPYLTTCCKINFCRTFSEWLQTEHKLHGFVHKPWRWLQVEWETGRVGAPLEWSPVTGILVLKICSPGPKSLLEIYGPPLEKLVRVEDAHFRPLSQTTKYKTTAN